MRPCQWLLTNTGICSGAVYMLIAGIQDGMVLTVLVAGAANSQHRQGLVDQCTLVCSFREPDCTAP